MANAEPLQIWLQNAGSIATTIAALFSAASAYLARSAVKEMRLSRRDALLPRISYSLPSKSLNIDIGEGEGRGVKISESRHIRDLPDGLSSRRWPKVAFINFGSPAMNVNLEFSFDSNNEIGNETFIKFMGDKKADILKVKRFLYYKSDKTSFMISVSNSERMFLPHIGANEPVIVTIPHAVLQMYAVDVIGSMSSINEDSKVSEVPDFPIIKMKMTFDSVDGQNCEQIFSFRYELLFYSAKEVNILAKALNATKLAVIDL